MLPGLRRSWGPSWGMCWLSHNCDCLVNFYGNFLQISAHGSQNWSTKVSPSVPWSHQTWVGLGTCIYYILLLLDASNQCQQDRGCCLLISSIELTSKVFSLKVWCASWIVSLVHVYTKCNKQAETKYLKRFFSRDFQICTTSFLSALWLVKASQMLVYLGTGSQREIGHLERVMWGHFQKKSQVFSFSTVRQLGLWLNLHKETK